MRPFVGFWKVLVCSAVISSLLDSHCPTFTCKVRGEFAAVEQTPSALFSRGSGRVLGWAALSVQFVSRHEGDEMKDVEVNGMIFGMFVSATIEAAVHPKLDY